ncbi:MAG: thiamine diphosphokinase [Clostridia bacterium]|nr:thiamine diphosphokinase [Clostridia bacterium]MBQ7718906.1 thiamine diphosphokinase [Clostridia bacterium]
MRAVIFSGGEIGDGTFYTKREGDYIICADSGYGYCSAFDITPDILIGDFDSLSDYEFENIIRYKKEKDETDTLLAVNLALEKGYKDIVIYGALGGREDHSIANIYLLKKIVDSGAEGIIEGGKNRIMLINKSTKIKRGNLKYLSVIPLFGGAEGVTLHGVKYPLENYEMAADDTIGVSNEIVSDCGEITVEKGYLLIIMSSD